MNVERARLRIGGFVVFVIFAVLVRNANVHYGLMTNDRFLTKSTKVHKDHNVTE